MTVPTDTHRELAATALGWRPIDHPELQRQALERIAQAIADAAAAAVDDDRAAWVYCPDCGTWLDYPDHREDCPHREVDEDNPAPTGDTPGTLGVDSRAAPGGTT